MPAAPARARLAAAGAWAVLIAALLWTAGPETSDTWGSWIGVLEDSDADKVGHAALFFVLAWLLCRCGRYAPTAAWLGGCLLLAVFYGALTEAVQVPLENRDGELGDLAADALGAAAGVAVFARWGSK